MAEKKRYNIGYFIHHLENDYSRALMKGVVPAAEDLDVNLFIFPGRALKGDFYDERYAAYEYQYNVLYSYACAERLDGIIVSAGTIGSFVSKEEFKTFLDRYEGIPLLTVENQVRGFPCIHFGSTGIKLVVEHLVKEHGCRRIAFVSGPKGNTDADTRLSAYLGALEEKLIAYGNFSEYSEEAVGQMLDRCGDPPEAICFANDQMTIGGYSALRKRGLEPGKDVLITGYDDSEVASSVEPMLTTVRADAAVLGYTAVEAMYKWLADGIEPDPRELSCTLVVRDSCGCAGLGSDSARLNSVIKDMDTIDGARTIVNVMSGANMNKRTARVRNALAEVISDVLSSAKSGGEIPERKLCDKFREFLEHNDPTEMLGYDTLISVIEAAQSSAVGMSGKVSGRHLRIMRLFEDFYRILSEYVIALSVRRQSDLVFCYFLISNITKDMMITTADEEKCFYSIINNLYRIHFRSSYIYTYGKPILNESGSQWTMPDKLYLKAYHDGIKLFTLKGDDQIVPWKSFSDNKYIDTSVRRTVVLSPLFANEMQYGLLVCDLDSKYFPFVYSVTPQICTAIKMIGLLKGLEGSLIEERNNNTLLNKMSMCDELTGVFNRRGFYKSANAELVRNKDSGNTAVLIFADLDNLKKINDTFGHDDGDYAISSAAGFLKSGLRSTDIVARIGGDEFAALAIVSDDRLIDEFPQRIKKIADEHNRKSDKPYNVKISIGTFSFPCGEAEHHIQDHMDKADEALYADKKNKDLDIMKKRSDV